MIKYAKIQYMIECSFYDAVERGDDRRTAAEKLVRMADSYEGLEWIIIMFTLICKLRHLNIEFTSDFLDQAVSAVQAFQEIPKEELEELIQREDYIQDMEVKNRNICWFLGRNYNVKIQNIAEEGK